MSLTYTEAQRLRRIPPLTAQETLIFYQTGQMPQRFDDSAEAERNHIIDQYTIYGGLTDENKYNF